MSWVQAMKFKQCVIILKKIESVKVNKIVEPINVEYFFVITFYLHVNTIQNTYYLDLTQDKNRQYYCFLGFETVHVLHCEMTAWSLRKDGRIMCSIWYEWWIADCKWSCVWEHSFYIPLSRAIVLLPPLNISAQND